MTHELILLPLCVCKVIIIFQVLYKINMHLCVLFSPTGLWQPWKGAA